MGLDTDRIPSLWLRKSDDDQAISTMRFLEQACAIVTDSHFLIPLAVFCIGLALLITLH
jgi:hypothetical protein